MKVIPCGECDNFQDPPIGLSLESLQIRARQNLIGRDYYFPISRQADLFLTFIMLKSSWKNDTQFLSSISEICIHPAYQQIIGMGPIAIPFILKELQRELDHWFWALEAITRMNPILPEHQGQVRLMAEDWFMWARTNGYDC